MQLRNDQLCVLHHPEGDPDMDILFFHGLPSAEDPCVHTSTWMSRDDKICWPAVWLPSTFPHARILAINYSAEVAQTRQSLTDFGLIMDSLLKDVLSLREKLRFNRPTILVGHSIGCLLIQQLCLKAAYQVEEKSRSGSERTRIKTFLQNVRGIFYFGPPHFESTLIEEYATRDRQPGASNNTICKRFSDQLFSRLNHSRFQDFVVELNASVAKIQHKFAAVQQKYDWRTYGVQGMQEDKSMSKLVKLASGSMGAGTWYNDSGANPRNVCKPDFQFSTSYRLLERLIKNCPSDNTIVADGRFGPVYEVHLKYVPVWPVFLDLTDALEVEVPDDASWHRLVNLYGGPGTGKTSMAEFVADWYTNLNPPDLQMVMDPDCLEDKKWKPDAVFIVDCSPQKDVTGDIKKKLAKLIDDLILELFAGRTRSQKKSNLDRARVDNRLSGAQERLSDLLKDRRVLIILDDVRRGEYLFSFIVRGKGIRYLVTSNNQGVWKHDTLNHLAAVNIPMVRPSMSRSMDILAAYGDPLPYGNFLQDPLQQAIEKVIKVCEYHPLVLRNVALAMSTKEGDGANDPRAWEDMYKKLVDIEKDPEQASTQTSGEHNVDFLDDDEETDEDFVQFSTESYPRAFDSSMVLMLDSLCEDSRRLFFLALVWDSNTGVPEALLSLSSQSIKIAPGKYVKLRKDLEDKSLIHCKPHYRRIRYYSIHKLERDIIVRRKKEELSSMFDSLLYPQGTGHADQGWEIGLRQGHPEVPSAQREFELVTSFGLLYGGSGFKDAIRRAAAQRTAIVRSPSVSNCFNNLVAKAQGDELLLLREVIEPLLLLLDTPNLPNLDDRIALSTKKAIIKFVCQGDLEDESTSTLMTIPGSRTAAVSFLREFTTRYSFIDYHLPELDFPKFPRKHQAAFSKDYQKTFDELMKLLRVKEIEGTDRSTAVEIVSELALYESKESIESMASTLAESMSLPSTEFCVDCMKAIRGEGEGTAVIEISELLLEHDGILKALNNCMSDIPKTSPSSSKLRIASEIFHLSVRTGSAKKMGAYPDFLISLVNLVKRFQCVPYVRSGPCEFTDPLSHKIDLLSSVRCRYNEEGLIPVEAIRALGRLTFLPENRKIMMKTENVAKLLESLVEAREGHDHLFWGVAAVFVGNFAVEPSLHKSISKVPGLKNCLLGGRKFFKTTQAEAMGSSSTAEDVEGEDVHYDEMTWYEQDVQQVEVKDWIRNEPTAYTGEIQFVDRPWVYVGRAISILYPSEVKQIINAHLPRIHGNFYYFGVGVGYAEQRSFVQALASFNRMVDSPLQVDIVYDYETTFHKFDTGMFISENPHIKYERFFYSCVLMSCYKVRALMGDYVGALEDLAEFKKSRDWYMLGENPYGNLLSMYNGLLIWGYDGSKELQIKLQIEEGVLKKMTSDLGGALSDLDKALADLRELKYDSEYREVDGSKILTWVDRYMCRKLEYECLKHRGHIKFLRNDEEGARGDIVAARAITEEPLRDCNDFQKDWFIKSFIFEIHLEFLGFQL